MRTLFCTSDVDFKIEIDECSDLNSAFSQEYRKNIGRVKNCLQDGPRSNSKLQTILRKQNPPRD